MEGKHINKRKNFDEDDWSKFKQSSEGSVGEKIDAGEIMEVTDRSITFNDEDVLKTKEEEYKEQSEDFKDGFTTTAQYLKFVNAHLADKKDRLDKILAAKERFANDIASLNPELVTKDYLDKKNYSNLKSNDIKIVLKHLEEEKNLLKDKIDHFSANIAKANEELEKKNKQIMDIESELSFKEMETNVEESQVLKEDDAVSAIQNELKSMASKNESEKIFGAINSLVVLLNSKNQATLNELNTVKNEFNKMKQEYQKIMDDLENKKSKKN